MNINFIHRKLILMYGEDESYYKSISLLTYIFQISNKQIFILNEVGNVVKYTESDHLENIVYIDYDDIGDISDSLIIIDDDISLEKIQFLKNASYKNCVILTDRYGKLRTVSNIFDSSLKSFSNKLYLTDMNDSLLGIYQLSDYDRNINFLKIGRKIQKQKMS